MATLMDIVLPVDSINVGGVTVELRGLNTNDVVSLVNGHRDVATKLYDMVVESKDKEKEADLAKIAADLVRSFPELVADIIAHSAQSPEARNVAMALPFPIQTEAFEKVLKLTFIGDNAVKKFLETVTNLMAGFNETGRKLSA